MPEAVNQWVSVDIELPPLDVPVWLAFQDGTMFVGSREDDVDGWLWGNCYSDYYYHDGWKCGTSDADDYAPTHWMSLPEPPDV